MNRVQQISNNNNKIFDNEILVVASTSKIDHCNNAWGGPSTDLNDTDDGLVEIAHDALCSSDVSSEAAIKIPVNLTSLDDEAKKTPAAEHHLLPGSSRVAKKSLSKKFVHFPADQNLVTQIFEPVKPLFVVRRAANFDSASSLNVHEVLQAYLNACKKVKIASSPRVEKQISRFHFNEMERQHILSLRGDRITTDHMDCLEEVFKRVQFVNLDFEYCFLDDDAVVSLSDMLEFYESCQRLNLSFNQSITFRGWQAFFRMVKKSSCLEQLNLRYTSLDERSLPLLSRCLKAPDVTVTSLHLENCHLSGRSMLLLASALKFSASVRDLHLAENDLVPSDGVHLYQIILNSASLELLDLRNNQLQDSGFAHICDALRQHPGEGRTNSKSKLNTLVLWNNKLTSHGMIHLIRVLLENKSLKTLNLGCNSLCSEGMAIIKESLARNRSLLRLGLQATRLNCQGAIAVAESIADNTSLIRVDLRANPDIKSAGLLAIHVALRMNETITSLNLDKSLADLLPSSKGKDHNNPAVDHFKSLFDDIASFCRRNYDSYVQRLMTSVKNKQLLHQNELDVSWRENEKCSSSPVDYYMRDSPKKNESFNLFQAHPVQDFEQQEACSTTEYQEINETDKKSEEEETDVILEKMIDDEQQEPACQLPCSEPADPRSLEEPEYFYNYNNPSKKCIRKISLTCRELIDNLKERYEQMPVNQNLLEQQQKESILTEEDETNVKSSSKDDNDDESSRKSGSLVAFLPPRPQSTPPIPINDKRSGRNDPLQRTTSLSLPLIGQNLSPVQLTSSPRPRTRRFSVSKVDQPAVAVVGNNIRHHSDPSQNSTVPENSSRQDKTTKQFDPNHNGDPITVKRDDPKIIYRESVLEAASSDHKSRVEYFINNLHANDVDKYESQCLLAKVTNVPESNREPKRIFSLDDEQSSHFQRRLITDNFNDFNRTAIVNQVITDLVRFAEYETRSTNNNNNNMSKSESMPTMKLSKTIVDKKLTSCDDEISLAVQQTMRSMIIKVCSKVNKPSSKNFPFAAGIKTFSLNKLNIEGNDKI